MGVTTMKRLDQGHLHPKLEVPATDMSQPGVKPVTPLEPFEQLVNSYLEHLHMSARPLENACDNTELYRI